MTDPSPLSFQPASTAYLSRRTGLLAAATAFLSGCSGAQILDRLVPSDNYLAETGLAYGSDARQLLDVYRPNPSVASAVAAPLPMVVFFYGGNWTRGSRSDYRFVGEALASAGAVVVVADYRLSPQVRYPEFVRDGALAMRWAFDNAPRLGVDSARVFVMGHSAGGHIAGMLALDPQWLDEQRAAPKNLAGWIGLAGAYDFLPIVDPEVKLAFNWPDTAPDSQPLFHASAGAPRSLLLLAESDSIVNPERNTYALAARLELLGVDVTRHAYPRANHVTLMAAMAKPLQWIAPVRADVLAFMGLA